MGEKEEETIEHENAVQKLGTQIPNHNPLIGLLHNDTLINVHDSLSLLQELTVSPPNGEFNISAASSNGLYFLLCCIIDALRFEIHHRDQLIKTDSSHHTKD